MLTDLAEQPGSLGRDTSPFGTNVPTSAGRDARWVEPRLWVRSRWPNPADMHRED
jgi:hypothetical protein